MWGPRLLLKQVEVWAWSRHCLIRSLHSTSRGPHSSIGLSQCEVPNKKLTGHRRDWICERMARSVKKSRVRCFQQHASPVNPSFESTMKYIPKSHLVLSAIVLWHWDQWQSGSDKGLHHGGKQRFVPNAAIWFHTMCCCS